MMRRAWPSFGERARDMRKALQAVRELESSTREVVRILRESKGPPHLRPPKGASVEGDQVFAPVLGIEPHRAEIEEIFETFSDDDEPDVAVWGWLGRAEVEETAATVAVRVGHYMVGHLSEVDSQRVSPWIAKMRRRRRVLWTDIFITRKADEYVVEVNLPARQP